MPTYESKCETCDKEHEYFATFSEYNTAMPMCCGKQTKKVILSTCAGYMQGDLDYLCPITEKRVTSYRQRKNIEAEHEVTVVEPGMFKRKPKEQAPDLPPELKPHLQPALEQLAKQG